MSTSLPHCSPALLDHSYSQHNMELKSHIIFPILLTRFPAFHSWHCLFQSVFILGSYHLIWHLGLENTVLFCMGGGGETTPHCLTHTLHFWQSPSETLYLITKIIILRCCSLRARMSYVPLCPSQSRTRFQLHTVTTHRTSALFYCSWLH